LLSAPFRWGAAVTVAAGHLSNKQGHNARQLRDLQQVAASRAAPRLLLGDLNLPSAVLLVASGGLWPETGRGRTFPNSHPTQQLDHVLCNDPAGVIRPAAPGWPPRPSATTAP
jgi:endonuclease/exonuclease/phosphatase family metal-dependent hydrolase